MDFKQNLVPVCNCNSRLRKRSDITHFSGVLKQIPKEQICDLPEIRVSSKSQLCYPKNLNEAIHFAEFGLKTGPELGVKE